MYHHILVPTDGSPLSSAAIDRTFAFAKALDARVTVLSVIKPFHVFTVDADQIESTRSEYEREAPRLVEHHLADAAVKAKVLDVPCGTLKVWDEHPYQAIIDAAADEGCDLIAMASHGRRGLAAAVLGSETSKVLTHSKLPVLIYR
jgi:nucleotide-binding universal stress UspA family protein